MFVFAKVNVIIYHYMGILTIKTCWLFS